ncbi:MAG: hypothetical protein LBI34_04060 [Puniceicoccales bacterium]|nr:hypothetical protein [Puniceicoccales bacterium]
MLPGIGTLIIRAMRQSIAKKSEESFSPFQSIVALEYWLSKVGDSDSQKVDVASGHVDKIISTNKNFMLMQSGSESATRAKTWPHGFSIEIQENGLAFASEWRTFFARNKEFFETQDVNSLEGNSVGICEENNEEMTRLIKGVSVEVIAAALCHFAADGMPDEAKTLLENLEPNCTFGVFKLLTQNQWRAIVESCHIDIELLLSSSRQTLNMPDLVKFLETGINKNDAAKFLMGLRFSAVERLEIWNKISEAQKKQIAEFITKEAIAELITSELGLEQNTQFILDIVALRNSPEFTMAVSEVLDENMTQTLWEGLSQRSPKLVEKMANLVFPGVKNVIWKWHVPADTSVPVDSAKFERILQTDDIEDCFKSLDFSTLSVQACADMIIAKKRECEIFKAVANAPTEWGYELLDEVLLKFIKHNKISDASADFLLSMGNDAAQYVAWAYQRGVKCVARLFDPVGLYVDEKKSGLIRSINCGVLKLFLPDVAVLATFLHARSGIAYAEGVRALLGAQTGHEGFAAYAARETVLESLRRMYASVSEEYKKEIILKVVSEYDADLLAEAFGAIDDDELIDVYIANMVQK